MATSSFVDLRVYQFAEQLADQAWDAVTRWRIFARDTVGKQLVRAADSVGANIAEGTGRGSFVDNRRFVRIARGSLFETRHWLRRAFQRKLLTAAEVKTFKVMLDRLGPMLNAYLSSIGEMKRPSVK